MSGFKADLVNSNKPNILFILSDDQDVTQHGMFPLKEVNRLLVRKGATFSNSVSDELLLILELFSEVKFIRSDNNLVHIICSNKLTRVG